MMWAPEDFGTEAPVISRIEDPEQLMAQIIECVEQKDAKGVKTYILEHKLKNEILFWDLILKLGSCINYETSQDYPGFFDVCNRCLVYLAKVGNPKEGLLAFLQQMDTFDSDDTKFKFFLQYVQIVLLKIPTKLFHSLDIALETLSAHLEAMPVPDNTQLEGDELKLFHLDEKVVRLNDVMDGYLSFLEALVQSAVSSRQKEVFSTESCVRSTANELLVLRKHLSQLFDHPLCHLILTYDQDKEKSDSRLHAEKAIDLLCKVESNLHSFITDPQTTTSQENVSTNKKEESISNSETQEKADVVETWKFKLQVSSLAKACLSYLIHSEFLGIDSFPQIYRHEFILELNLYTLCQLIQNTTFAINFKGLLFCKDLTERVSKHSLVAECLDNPGYMAVLNGLIHVMVKCPVRDHRSLATTVFPTFISRFERPGRHRIYQNILSACEHSSLKGYLITLLKNDVGENLKAIKQEQSYTGSETGIQQSSSISKEDMDENNRKNRVKDSSLLCFTGNSLWRLMKLVLTLPEGEKSDMLENSNQIISALNFLRFLFLADPLVSNQSGIWDCVPYIEKDFMAPLRLGLDLSEAHYKLERDNIKQDRPTKLPPEDGSLPEMSVSVEGAVLPTRVEKEKQLDLLDKALNTHSMMVSLLCRVSEIVEQHKAQ